MHLESSFDLHFSAQEFGTAAVFAKGELFQTVKNAGTEATNVMCMDAVDGCVRLQFQLGASLELPYPNYPNCQDLCVDCDGNILDAVLLVAVAALRDTKIPAVELADSGVVVECDKPAKPLTVKAFPVCLTLALFENIEGGSTDMVVDPTEEEEKLSQATITVIVVHSATGNWKASAANAPIMVHKAGGLPVTSACLEEAIQCARERSLGTMTMLFATD